MRTTKKASPVFPKSRNLSRINFTGDGLSPSPSTLTLISRFARLDKVTRIDLSGSNLGNDLRYLDNLDLVDCLILDGCGLTDAFVPPNIARLETLRSDKKNPLLSLK